MKWENVHAAYVGPYPPIKGGISQHGERVVHALRERTKKMEVISWRRQYPRALYPGEEADVSGELDTHYLKWWSPRSWLRARRNLKDVDLLVFQWVTPFHVLALRLIAGGTSAATVAIVHNAEPHERFPLARTAMRWILRSTDAVVTHSEEVAKQVATVLPVEYISVVSLPPNLDLRSLALPESENPRLLFFGYVRPYKGLRLLIEAVAVLKERGHILHLTVAGETWGDPAEFVALARGLGVDDWVDFRFGYVPDSAVESLFANHHMVVQPYLSASQSAVIPLAFSAGRPVVVTPVGGLSETVISGVNGVVADEVAPESVASAITECLSSLELLAEGALRSSASWSKVASVVLEAGIGEVDE